MLGRLTMKAVNSRLGYTKSKAMAYVMEALYINDKLLYNRFKVLGSTTAVFMKATFSDSQGLKTRVNGYDNN